MVTISVLMSLICMSLIKIVVPGYRYVCMDVCMCTCMFIYVHPQCARECVCVYLYTDASLRFPYHWEHFSAFEMMVVLCEVGN